MVDGEFESLLKQAMGLDAASIGSPAVERAVRARASACGLKDANTYLERVRASATELQALIEEVVVPETWFFRDREAFAALARIAREEWLPAHSEGALRVLSLPCSTGEEPYSTAMALLDAGIAANRCRIDAVDISAPVLAHARRAVYGKNSFRGAELAFRDRYFEATAHGYHLRDAVRQQVRFQHGNMFAADFLPGEELYDVIFCRNLLIYFDGATQDRAVQLLKRLLAAKGVLFVAPSETGLLLNHGFVSAKVPMAFAFRKIGAVPQVTAAAFDHAIRRHRQTSMLPGIAPRLHPVHGAAKRIDSRPKTSPEPSAKVDTGMNLDGASRLADQGHLVEAAKTCEEHLRVHGPSARAFHLLGLIRAATGNLKEADQFYRKALYLDRDHRDALVHLALLLEKRGDATGAQVLRSRAQRLELRSAK
jgi:chemotaxis protein methyltransferase WspC